MKSKEATEKLLRPENRRPRIWLESQPELCEPIKLSTFFMFNVM